MRSIEIFSGAGGLALGLEGAGFESVALVERNRDACATLRLNRPRWNVLEADIREIDFRSFGAVDLVAGGPPCQPFSMGGKANGYDDHRDMFPQAVRAVRELRPGAFLFENVRGLLRPAFSNYVEYIKLQFTYPDFPISKNASWEVNLQRLQKHSNSAKPASELRYNVSIQLANAANYGVPQHRHRVFFTGFRSDLESKWFFPSPTHTGAELWRAQFLEATYWKEHGLKVPSFPGPAPRPRLQQTVIPGLFAGPARWRTVRDAMAGLGDPGKKSLWQNQVFQPGAKSYSGHTGSPLDEPAKALKAGDHGVPGGENMMRYPDGTVRYFTVRESARIQTFPDNYIFSGSWTESMRQLGNAVPVALAEAVASSIASHLQPYGRRIHLQSAR
jgi:DNA (cytosine-5)-methyltransferase 1